MNARPSFTNVQNENPSTEDIVPLEVTEWPPSELSERPKRSPPHPLSIHVLALLIPASIFGLLTRLGLDALATYDGHSIFPLAYAQGLGCLVMGFALGLKEPFGFYPPLYTAVTTGYCGSLTTFSGWQVDVFNSWTNAGQFDHGGLRNFIDGLGKSVFTLSISITSVSFGVQLASVVRPHFPAIMPPGRKAKYTITFLSILTYGGVFPAYFLMSPKFRPKATAALLFAFPGALTRYLLSVHFNTVLKTIPLGTFMANSVGTALLGGLNVLQTKASPISPYACGLLQGLDDGYCGCLTTISTFAVEIRGLGIKKGSRYALISWCVGQILLVVIVGTAIWTGHSKEQITCTPV